MKNLFYLILFFIIPCGQITFAAVPMDTLSHKSALLDSAKHWSIKEAGIYYQRHSEDQNFLRQYIISHFMNNLDGMDYFEVRTLRRAFWGTNLQDYVNPFYMKRRTELQPKIKAEVESHCKAELDSVESCRMVCKRLLVGYIGSSIEEALTGLMGGFLPDGKNDIQKLYLAHCAASIRVNVIKDTINNHVVALVRQINVSRKNYINNLAGYYAAIGGYQVGKFGYLVKRHPVDCPIDDLVSFQQIQGQINWYNLGLDKSALVYKGVGQKLLLGQYLLSPYQINRNGNTRKLGPIVNNIAKATAINIEKSIYQTLEEVFDSIFDKIKKSQIGFQNIVFAKY